MSDKWTPGPWNIDERNGETGPGNVGRLSIGADGRNGGMYIANCFGPHRNANAALIAAAPDMAEALDELLAVATGFACTHFTDAQIATARAALAKARGQL